jgi:hypothetical protein
MVVRERNAAERTMKLRRSGICPAAQSPIHIYTPFFRRFTDERARDIAETKALYTSVRARYLSSPYAPEDAIKDFVLRLADYDKPCVVEFCVLLDGILQMEDSIFGSQEVNIEHLSLKEQVDLNRYHQPNNPVRKSAKHTYQPVSTTSV